MKSAYLFFIACTLANGCAASDAPPPVVAGAPAARPASTCPFGLRDVQVAVDDTEDGVDLTLTTLGDVTDLRRRARDSAAMFGPGAHRGEGHDGVHGRGHHHGLGLEEITPPVRAAVQDVAGGARIHIAPQRPSDGDAVRAEVHSRVERTTTGECP